MKTERKPYFGNFDNLNGSGKLEEDTEFSFVPSQNNESDHHPHSLKMNSLARTNNQSSHYATSPSEQIQSPNEEEEEVEGRSMSQHQIYSGEEAVDGRRGIEYENRLKRVLVAVTEIESQLMTYNIIEEKQEFQVQTARLMSSSIGSTISSIEDVVFRLNIKVNTMLQSHDQIFKSIEEKIRLQVPYQREQREQSERVSKVMQDALSSKKQLECKLIEVSQDLQNQEQECFKLRNLLSKAQSVIMKLTEGSYIDTETFNTGRETLQEIDSLKASRSSAADPIKELEAKLRQEYEVKFSEVQRKSEEILTFYKKELSKQKLSMNHDWNRTLLSQSDCKGLNISFKRTTFSDQNSLQIMQDNDQNLYSTTQIALEAYIEAIDQVKMMKLEISSLNEQYQNQLNEINQKYEDLKSNFEQPIQNIQESQLKLRQDIKERDIVIEEMYCQIQDLKQIVIEYQNAYQQIASFKNSQFGVSQIYVDDIKCFDDLLKHRMAEISSLSISLHSTSSKQFTQMKHHIEYQVSLIEKLQESQNKYGESSYKLQNEIERQEDLLKKSGEERQIAEQQLKALGKRIKEVWQTQCESYLYDINAVSVAVDSFSQLFGWIDFISSEMNLQKKKIAHLKEEQYKLLQLLSSFDTNQRQAFPVQQCKLSGQPPTRNTSKESCCFIITDQSSLDFRKCQGEQLDPMNNRSFQSINGAVHTPCLSMQTNNSNLTSLVQQQQQPVSFKQLKRNELCEILREEIRALSQESNAKNEIIITLKKHIEIDQEGYLDKCTQLKQSQSEATKLLDQYDQIALERDELHRINKVLRHSLTEKCHELDDCLKKNEIQSQQVLIRKEQLIKDIKALKEEIDDLRRTKGEVEGRLELANDKNADMKRKEREYFDTNQRTLWRLAEKERQNETLRTEIERIIKLNSELEQKIDQQVPVMKPAQVQTEVNEDHYLLLQENDKVKRELQNAKFDLMDIHEQLSQSKHENLKLEEVSALMKAQFQQLQKDFQLQQEMLDKERLKVDQLMFKEANRKEMRQQRRAERKKQQERCHTQACCDDTLLFDREGQLIFNTEADQEYVQKQLLNNKESEPSFQARDFVALPMRSKSINGVYKTLGQTADTQDSHTKATDLSHQARDLSINDSMTTFKRSKSRKCLAKSRNTFSKPQLSTIAPSQQQYIINTTLGQDSTRGERTRALSALQINAKYHPMLYQTYLMENNKENMITGQSFENLPINANELVKLVKLKYKRKLKKRMMMLEDILTSLAVNDYEKLEMRRDYFSKKYPKFGGIIQDLKLKSTSAQFEHFFKLATQIIKVLNTKDELPANLIEHFSRSVEQNQIVQAEYSANQLISGLISSIEKLVVQNQRTISSKLNTLNQESMIYVTLSSDDKLQSSQLNERALFSKILRLESRLKAKVSILSKFHELFSQWHKNAQFPQSLSEFTQQLKIDSAYDHLLMTQLIKSLHESNASLMITLTTIESSEESVCIDSSGKFIKLLEQMQEQATNMQGNSFQNLEKEPNKGSILERLLKVYDKLYLQSSIQEHTIPSFVDRMLLRLRKKCALPSSLVADDDKSNVTKVLNSLIDEVKTYQMEHNSETLPSLMILQEYLEIRLQILQG